MTIVRMLNVQKLTHFGPIFLLLGRKSEGFHRTKMHQTNVWQNFIFTDATDQQPSTAEVAQAIFKMGTIRPVFQ